jgi:hypothetical protein
LLPVELEEYPRNQAKFERLSLSSMIMICIERYLAEAQKRK